MAVKSTITFTLKANELSSGIESPIAKSRRSNTVSPAMTAVSSSMVREKGRSIGTLASLRVRAPLAMYPASEDIMSAVKLAVGKPTLSRKSAPRACSVTDPRASDPDPI